MKYVTKLEIKWALIFFFSMLIWMTFECLMGWHSDKIALHQYVTNIFAGIAIAVYVFALLDKKKSHYNGQMSWKQGIISGMVLTTIVTLLSPLGQYITSTIITPDFFTNIIKYSVEVEGKNLAEMQAYFNLENYLIEATIGSFIMGTITTIVVAFFVKSKKKVI